MVERRPSHEHERREVVRLNESFPPFLSIADDSTNEIPSIIVINIPIILSTGVLPDYRINIFASTSKTSDGIALVPFNPEVGYSITGDDLEDSSRREEKMSWYRNPKLGETIFQKAPLNFSANTYWSSEFRKHGMLTASQSGVNTFTPDTLAIVERLRMQVRVNDQSYEAKPDVLGLRIGVIAYEQFYPLDTGPLAKVTSATRGFEQGLSLYLPSDSEKLKMITASFALDREQPRDDDPPYTII